MTRKRAIEIVVANVKKMGWPHPDWLEARIYYSDFSLSSILEFSRGTPYSKPERCRGGWFIPRKWLEEKGYL